MSQGNQHQDLSGALFQVWANPNSKEWIAAKPGRPDFSGECTIDGQYYRVAAWNKISQVTGRPFISFCFTPAQRKVKP